MCVGSKDLHPKNINDLLILSTDAKGVVMRPEGLRAQTRKRALNKKPKLDKRLCAGEKRYAKRMPQVAAVYDIAPWRREPDNVLRGLRPVQGVEVDRPRPEGKRVWASIIREPVDVINEMFAEALSRDVCKQRTWVALVDGNGPQIAALKAMAKENDVKLTIVMDAIHVLEYLWKASACFYPAASGMCQ